jgi:hypothetical protein
MDRAEKVAMQVVQTLIPGARMIPHDLGMNGKYDFNLLLPSGDSYPLEVTSATDRSARSTTAAILDEKKGGQFVQGKHCKRSWYLQPAPTARINDIRKRADSYLAALEEAGIEKFVSPFEAQSVAVKAICHDLRLEAAWSWQSQQPQRICIGLPNKITMLVDGAPAAEAALAEAWKEDNRRKLGQMTALRQYLFVYVDHSCFAAWFAMNHFDPPQSMAVLPPEITNIWVAAQKTYPETFVVWQTRAGYPWENNGSIRAPTS